ncbi:MAG: DUF547 domain-containing protein [Burkholderiaceae bacterium]
MSHPFKRLPDAFRALLVALALAVPTIGHAALDHQYPGWQALLEKHVAWTPQGGASTVDYQGFLADREALGEVLQRLSSVTLAQYEGFSRDQQLAFLINAYNAFTVELILTKYPDLTSIKDLGSFFSSPWKKAFFSLLGQQRTLDWIEHEMIRAPGVFDEPRIHFVVNCASVGCPALRPGAMLATRLEQQLADSTRRFLGDRSRNRYDPAAKRLLVSKIFDWYGGDFAKGHQGIDSLEQFFASHAQLLADGGADCGRSVRMAGEKTIRFLDYDWSLNRR